MDNLDTMSIEELRDLRLTIDKAISSFKARQRKAAMAAAEDAATQHGYTMAQLVNGQDNRSSKGSTSPVPGAARYAN